MIFEKENSGSTTYLTCKVPEHVQMDRISLGMLTNNKIPGILATTCYMKDQQRILRYNVSSKVSLSLFFASRLNKKQLLTVFKSITEAFLAAEEYMLLPEQFLIDAENIYVNASTAEAYLICRPVEGLEEEADMRLMFKELLFNTQFATGDNGNYVMEISNYLNGRNNFSVMDFRELLKRLSYGNTDEKKADEKVESTPVIPVPSQPVLPVQIPDKPVPAQKKEVPEKKKRKWRSEKPQNVTVGKQTFQIPGMDSPVAINPGTAFKEEGKEKKARKEKNVKEKKPIFSFLKKEKKGEDTETAVDIPQPEPIIKPVLPHQDYQQSSFTGETTVLESPAPVCGETTVLGAAGAYLYRKKNGERIELNTTVLRMGKEKSHVDYCIADNSAVSRKHAEIRMKEGGYYIMDQNSLNHTYVGGRQLVNQEQVLLQDGDQILLANEEFEFKEY